MSRPWMPLYIADYLADTAHLSAAEHGAYLLLIMHYWQTGGLPQDDCRLARIARMTPQEWTIAQPVIARFFDASWRHERIDGELAEAERLTKAGRKGGEASADARRNKRNPRPSRPHSDDDESGSTDRAPSGAPANDPRNATIDHRSAKQTTNDFPTIVEAPQPHSHLQEDDEIDAPARRKPTLISAEAHALATNFLKTIGFPNPIDVPIEFAGTPWRAQVWIEAGWTETTVLATARKIINGRPAPPGLKYFETAIANAVASLNAPIPQGSPTEKPNATTSNILAAADRLVERVRQFDLPAPAEPRTIRSRTSPTTLRAISTR